MCVCVWVWVCVRVLKLKDNQGETMTLQHLLKFVLPDYDWPGRDG